MKRWLGTTSCLIDGKWTSEGAEGVIEAIDPATEDRIGSLPQVEEFVASAHDKGAELLCGGQRPANCDKGFFFEPTVFIGENRVRIAQEEIFLDGLPNGLGAGGGQGPGWGEVPGGIGQSGAFGGFKQSGLGREWGRSGVEGFTEVKSMDWGLIQAPHRGLPRAVTTLELRRSHCRSRSTW